MENTKMDILIHMHAKPDMRAETKRKDKTVWLSIKNEGYGGFVFFFPSNCPDEIAQTAADAINAALAWGK